MMLNIVYAMPAAQARAIRKSHGLTIGQWAERCRVSRQTVQHWEAGRQPVHGTARTLLETLLQEGQ